MKKLTLKNGLAPIGNNGAVHVTISRKDLKLDGINRIDCSSCGNKFCQAKSKDRSLICSRCYGRAMENRFRKENYGVYCEYNSAVLSEKILTDVEIPRFAPLEIIRYNGNGELVNGIHYRNVIAICKENPHCTFALWTKRKVLVSRTEKEYGIVKPGNLIKVYSNPKIDAPMTTPPAGFDIVFNCFTAEYALRNNIRINCGGKQCRKCLNCYGGRVRKDGIRLVETVVNEIIKDEYNKFLKGGGMVC